MIRNRALTLNTIPILTLSLTRYYFNPNPDSNLKSKFVTKV